jgi:pantetheine-phosphate adenylyltransferase
MDLLGLSAGNLVAIRLGFCVFLPRLRRMRTAVYPGSFDPITNGHLDVIQRAARLFDRVIVAVAINESKTPMFSMAQRKELTARAVEHLPNVEVDTFTGLLVDYVSLKKGEAVIRGLRAVSDFEFEFQLALMNRKLNEKVETIFMMPKETYTFISSRMIKEVARLGGDVSSFVPAHVEQALHKKVGNGRKAKAS